MREKAVKAPGLEPEQKEALGRTERSDSKKGLPGRRQMGPPGPRQEGPPESSVRRARGIRQPRGSGEPGRSVRANPSRHATKCRVCNHPDRAAIEFDFLNWRNPADLARSYRLRDLSTIYRHAHATGLFSKRRLNLRFALERIVERVGEVPVTATSVIRAARAISRINDAGEWNDPPTRLIIERSDSPEPPVAEPSTASVKIKSRPAPIFDPVLLDEPSPSAESAGEMPRINGKSDPAAPQEVILQIAPALYEGVQARRQAAQSRLSAADAADIERIRKESLERTGELKTKPDPKADLIANETHSRGESND